MSKVDHPSHYNQGKIEVIDAIEDWKLGFHEGNVVKYVARARHKGNELEDLKKAAWYLNRAIEKLEKTEHSEKVHAYFSQNYAGTACGATGAKSDLGYEVTCEICKKWFEPVQTVHIANPDGWKNVPLCNRSEPGAMTADPMAATCVECKRIHDQEAVAKDPYTVIHLVNPDVSFGVYCGKNTTGITATSILQDATCEECQKAFIEKKKP